MKRKLLLLIPLFLCSLLLVNVAGATWSLSDSNGYWLRLSNTEWETQKNDDYYDAVYTDSKTIVTSWVFALTLYQDTWFDWGQFWVAHYIKHSFYVEMSNLGKTIGIGFERKRFRNIGNLGMGDGWLTLKFKDNGDYEDIISFKTQLKYFRFYAFKKSDTSLNITIINLEDRNGEVSRTGLSFGGQDIHDDWTVSGRTSYALSCVFTVPSGWFTDLDLTQKMIKESDGWIHGYKDDESFDVYSDTIEREGETVDLLRKVIEVITAPIYNLLPDWARGIVDIFSGIGAVFVQTILPNLAVLLSAYIVINLGLGFQNLSDSITEMSDLNVANFKDIVIDAFKPLYDLFLWIISFVTRIAQLIMEIIPF